ncbi:MAG: NAD(P)-dependent oxidoreductase [Polyangiales bacterium]
MAVPMLDGKVLITGARGFIGGRLRDALLSAGNDVVAIRRPGSPPSKSDRSVEADYARVADLERVIAAEKPDYVLHVAGVTKGTSYEDFRSGNVMPTRNLLAAVRREHPTTKRFVFVSSSASYGPSATSAPQREENPPRPIEHYGESKLEAERVVEAESGPVAWTIVRPCAVYGPGDVDHFTLFQGAMLGVNLFYGNRRRLMSWIYVDDCVRGILESATHTNSAGKGYFLTNDVQLTWDQFQTEIATAVGRRVRTVDLPEALMWASAFAGEIATRIDHKPRLMNLQKARLGVQEAWTCSGDAARRDFGFSATVELPEGIRRTHEWYLENGWYKSLDPRELVSSRSLRRLVRHLRRGG